MKTEVTTLLLMATTAACCTHANTLELKPTNQVSLLYNFEITYKGKHGGVFEMTCSYCEMDDGRDAGCVPSTTWTERRAVITQVTNGEVERRGTGTFAIIPDGRKTATVKGTVLCNRNNTSLPRIGAATLTRPGDGTFGPAQITGEITETIPSDGVMNYGKKYKYYEPAGGLKLTYADAISLKYGETKAIIERIQGPATAYVIVDQTALPQGLRCFVNDPRNTAPYIQQGDTLLCQNQQEEKGVTKGDLTVGIALR